MRKDKISNIYLKVRVKTNPEGNQLQIHAYDLNPNRKTKKIVQTYDNPFNPAIIEMMKHNFDIFLDYIVIKESKYAPGQLEMDLSKLLTPEVAELIVEKY